MKPFWSAFDWSKRCRLKGYSLTVTPSWLLAKLMKLASNMDFELLTVVPTEHLSWPLISKVGEVIILHSIVSDNGRQFDNKNVRDLCKEFGIKKKLSSPHHQQANGQVETVNKTIKYTLRESKMPQKELGLMSYI
ncbi:uncharacterized protein LOC111379948, partial [Olea europaea var. sylvestris]|uniref:uncharacterized protein LOC111379948 n=1 Tax=Olea europaea var. sylvestris TaxID=158386 RepID=UPI000C1D5D3E